jgi:hypothetical protein
MCNLYSITTNQVAIIALFRVIDRYVGNLPPMPGVLSHSLRVLQNFCTGRFSAVNVVFAAAAEARGLVYAELASGVSYQVRAHALNHRHIVMPC